jgi:hypothetical protein
MAPEEELIQTNFSNTSRLDEELLSPEDKMILYASLQEIANELRRIRRERQKNQQAEQQQPAL